MSEIRISHWAKLGSVVRDARTRRQWSQHDLARRAGVSRSWLAKVEAGHRGAELEPILRLLAALDLRLVVRDEGSPSTDTDAPRRRRPTAVSPGRAAATEALIAAHESAAAERRHAWGIADGGAQAR